MASSVNLGLNLEGVVDHLVRAGRYGSRSEVLREGVRLVQEREARLARFEAEIAEGVADVEAGRSTDSDHVFDRLQQKYEGMATKTVG